MIIKIIGIQTIVVIVVEILKKVIEVLNVITRTNEVNLL
jgi:hypothetical protein